jgi:hypothetical protein
MTRVRCSEEKQMKAKKVANKHTSKPDTRIPKPAVKKKVHPIVVPIIALDVPLKIHKARKPIVVPVVVPIVLPELPSHVEAVVVPVVVPAAASKSFFDKLMQHLREL